jgi:Ferritin-like domain
VGADRHLRGYGGRCGFGRTAAVLALCAATTLPACGCGKSGQGARTDPEKAADAAILNAALSQELTAVDAYARGRSLLRGRFRAVGREFRAQEQEYVDALTKAIRGVGGETDAEAGELDFAGVKSQAGFLALAYELESAALSSDLGAAPRLDTAAPRGLAASLAAGHAQHLVVLRQGLGAGPAASVPQAFDGGEVPPPGHAPPSGGG